MAPAEELALERVVAASEALAAWVVREVPREVAAAASGSTWQRPLTRCARQIRS